MVPGGLSRGLTLSVLLASLGVSPAAAQFYLNDFPAQHEQPVSTRKATMAAIPQVVVRGDYALSGWSSDLVFTPGLSVLRLSTGEALWKELAEPGDTLTAWLRGSTVFIERGGARTAGRICQWRDLETGALRKWVSVTADSGLSVSLLQTVAIIVPRDVYDLESGEYLGRLSDEFDVQLMEFRGQIYAYSQNARGDGQRELVAADLSDLSKVQRWDLSAVLPEDRAWAYRPVITDGRWFVFSGPSEGWSGISLSREQIAPQSLVAMDLERGELAWQREVPRYAPLRFIHATDDSQETAMDVQTIPVQPLTIDWSSGRLIPDAAPRNSADRIAWVTGALQRMRTRQLGDLSVLHFVSGDQEQLVGLDATGVPVWHRGLRSMSALQDQAVEGFTVRLPETGPYAVALAGGSFEILDLHTGETVRSVSPEALGFNRRRAVSPAAGQASAESGQTASGTSGPWLDVRESMWLVVLVLMGGYLAVRVVANFSESKLPRSRG